MEKSTLIVGGGIAGISCALKLQEANVPYTMISPNIGGRICYLDNYRMNFGAVFFMQGYKHARRILTPTSPVLSSYLDLECHMNLGKGYGVLSAPIVSAAPQLLKFLAYLKNTFQPRYEAYKIACETREVEDAIAADPYIKELFEMSATDMIEREGFPKAAEVLASQFVYACTGSPIATLNALDYLNCAMGLVDTAMRFTFNPDEMRQTLEQGGEVIEGSVVSVAKVDDGWKVTTEAGEAYTAKNVVMAAPADITRTLLEPTTGPYEIRDASELHAYKVVGKIKPEYGGHKLHLFDQSIPLINIGMRWDDAYEVFTCKPLDMGIFFDEYEVLHTQDWPQALFTHPSIILRQDLGDGLYRAGDHNALGLEPAAISGVFVANRIIETAN